MTRTLSLVAAFCVCLTLPAMAGNRAMVEKDVAELNRLNKMMLRQYGPLPKNGTLDLRARVVPGPDGVRLEPIDNRTVSPPAAMSHDSGDDSTAGDYQLFSQALRVYLLVPAAIVGPPAAATTADKENYVSFTKGLRRYLRSGS